MPKFNVAVDHELPREDVVFRLKKFAILVREDAPVQVTNVTEEWDEQGNLTFSFRAMGFSVSGSVVACTQAVTVAGNLPFAALPFRGAIETQIREKVRQAIG